MNEARKGIVLQMEVKKQYAATEAVSYPVMHWFYISVGNSPNKQDKTKLFLPLEEGDVQKLERHFAANPPFAKAHVMVGIKKPIISWFRFYPFGEYFPASDSYKTALRGTRIGEKVHHAITEWLAANFPGYLVNHSSHWKIEPSRQAQLRGMGIDFKRSYPIAEYRDIVRQHMARRFGMRF